MNYFIAIIIVVVLAIIYGVIYFVNSKQIKPTCNKEVTCNLCGLNCNNRKE